MQFVPLSHHHNVAHQVRKSIANLVAEKIETLRRYKQHWLGQALLLFQSTMAAVPN